MIQDVAIVSESATRDGGAGGHVESSVRALRRAGCRVRLVAGALDPATAHPDSTVLPGVTDGMVDDVIQLLSQAEPTVVHLHDIWDRRLVDAVAGRWPVVLSVHNHATCASGQRYLRPGDECRRTHGPACLPIMLSGRCTHRLDPRPVLGQYRRTSEHLDLLRQATAVIGYSRFVTEDLQRAGLPAVHLVPYFAEPPPVTTPPPNARRIVFAGRLVPQKGLHVLLEALRSVDGSLVVLGDGWARDDLLAHARRAGVADRLDLRGWSSAADVRAAMTDADLVCVPSVWPEPFGIVGIEAMAAGRPVVASSTGGIPEWLQDDTTGLLTPPGDRDALAAALDRVLGDPDAAVRMGAAGRDHVEARFSERVHLDALTAVYEHARRRG